MNRKKLFSYTKDSLDEFLSEKKETDIIAVLYDDKELFNIEPDKKYYINITNLYKSLIDTNPALLEVKIFATMEIININFIIDHNCANKFLNVYTMFFDGIVPLNSIYEDVDECHRDFSQLLPSDLKKIEDNINNRLFGHNEFKIDFLEQINNFSILRKINESNIFSIFICGSSGVGKTEIARVIHDTLYSYSKPIKISIGNYNTEGALNSLIGSPKGYKGSERGGELTNKISRSSSKVILIDEFEKGDSELFNFFYELLEDGKFTDLDENEYDLSGYLIIFTTNLNTANYKKIIPTPLLSRFTMQYNFEELSFSDKKSFVNFRIANIIASYKNNTNVCLDFEIIRNKILDIDINNLSNLRYINRLIHKAFIDTVNEDIRKNK